MAASTLSSSVCVVTEKGSFFITSDWKKIFKKNLHIKGAQNL